ncbi:hypothetical protein CUMW_274390 [Citrus unshiu]|uniref:ATPase AAA-type core domain-containing protein n=1 Tax=Citrus unshiu TaxID=55188 RepID=A0A2H5MYS2_CITUN|nr:hypothetical protein CUMW_274390 [Citrus unshiu]
MKIVDIFNGVQLKWKLGSKQVQEQVFESVFRFARIQGKPVGKSEVRFFELSFHKKYKQIVLDSYIPHVLKKSEEISQEKKTLKLFTLKDRNSLRGYVWHSVNLGHPATFDTMAMDFDVKKMIMDDLEMFLKRKDFHRRVGKAWKCGYLLFGPRGRGKSSLIAGMAKFLNFDVFDLELSALLRRNMELRNLLIATENKSLLVVEDIDCSIELQNRHAQALAVNPMVSNMNYTARPGINQGPQEVGSKCWPPTTLGSQSIHSSQRLKKKVIVTPADVAEQLMRSEIKKREQYESKAKKLKEERAGEAEIEGKVSGTTTFDTLAMDSNMKHMKMDDLERFVKRKEFYRNVGKAWKRGVS